MKVKNIKLKGNNGFLQVEESDAYFLNSIRRVMLSELPKLAIENVIIYDNTSPLFDEIISHRLGMIPLPTDLRLLEFKENCKCNGKGCPSCTVRYTLSKEEAGTVYSGDLQPEHESWAIKDDKIPIVELSKDQRIILEVEANLGMGKKHAKFQPVQAPTYKMQVTLDFDDKKINEVKEFIDKLPKNIVELKGKKLELIDIKNLPILESYMDRENVDFISIKKDPTKLIFSFETDGSLSAKDALKESINIIIDKYERFDKEIKKLK